MKNVIQGFCKLKRSSDLQTTRSFQSHQPTHRSRNSNTPSLITSNPQIHLLHRRQIRSPRTASPSRMAPSTRITYQPRSSSIRSSRNGDILANDFTYYSTRGIENSSDDGCVSSWYPVLECVGANESGNAGYGDVVFDAEGFAFQ